MGKYFDAFKAEAKAAAKRRAWSVATLGFWEGPDLEGWITVGDPNCRTCGGRGEYGGLPAFPGQPRSGVKPITCDCARSMTRREWRAEQEAQRQPPEPVPHSRPLDTNPAPFEEWMLGDPDPDGSAKAAKERLRREQQKTGEATLCCMHLECDCGQNLRLIDGAPTKVPGTFLPGSEHEKFMTDLHARARERRAQRGRNT